MADLNKTLVKIGLGRVRPGSKHVNLGKVTNKALLWPALVEMLTKVHRTPETFAEFMKLPKEGIGGQDALKASAGWWIAAACRDESRRYTNLLPRTVLTFDFDYATAETIRRLDENDHALRDYVWFAHTTRKHTPEKPRLRFVVLLKEPVPTEQYEALARTIASLLDPGLVWTDAVSFRATQLMYFPTASADGEFLTFQGPGEKLVDWKHLFERMKAKGRDLADVRNWPRKPDEDAVRQRATKAEDPWEKPGLIGAFCRVYPIETLIAEHLSDFYEPGDATSTDVRYSWKHGGTSNGVVIYEDGRFVTSHHTSDPLAGASANAWDFARLVLYGDEDEANVEVKDVTKLPSYKLMTAWARTLPEVQNEMLETMLDADEAFDEEEGDQEFFDGPETEVADDDILGPSSRTSPPAEIEAKPTRPPEDWKSHLVRNEKLEIENNLPNVIAIMRWDPRWFGKVRYNELAEKAVLLKPIKFKDKPWSNLIVQDERNGDPIQDHHRLVFRAVMESGQGKGMGKGGYGFSNVSQVNLTDGIDGASRYDPFHPVKAFLGPRPKWDGVRKLHNGLQKHLGVEDNAFTREAFRLMMIAAVARVFEPGMKFDHLLLIQGKQGAGKSTFLKMLGKVEWHREFDIGFDDPQKIVEKTLGAVILEMSEIAGFKKSDQEDFKQFMSAQSTVVRMAYGREARIFPRRYVCFGTTNEEQPLKDMTGNRRVWFVRSTNEEESGIADLAALQVDVDQYWHEAYHDYLAMRAVQPHGDLPLYLSAEARRISAASNAKATAVTEFSMMADQIDTWADMPITKLEARNGSTEDPKPDDDEMVLRSRLSPREVWVAALDQHENRFNADIWKLKKAFEHLPGWSWEKENRKMLNGVRAIWAHRKGATAREIAQGYMDAPPDDEDDVIG